MAFKDYYQILGISHIATHKEIKQAYRRMSKKWHPDMNPDRDVTEMMQDINEAYSILKDTTSRTRYNIEYQKFIKKEQCQSRGLSRPQSSTWNFDYDVTDPTLRDDIDKARRYAKELVNQFLQSMKYTSKEAAQGAGKAMAPYLVTLAVFLIISVIFLLLGVSCVIN